MKTIFLSSFIIFLSCNIFAQYNLPVDSLSRKLYPKDIEFIENFSNDFIKQFDENNKVGIIDNFNNSIMQRGTDNLKIFLESNLIKENSHITVIPKSILLHGAKKNVWGSYFLIMNDKNEEMGYIFFVLNLNDIENPTMIISTFQNMEEVLENGVYTFEDFFIP